MDISSHVPYARVGIVSISGDGTSFTSSNQWGWALISVVMQWVFMCFCCLKLNDRLISRDCVNGISLKCAMPVFLGIPIMNTSSKPKTVQFYCYVIFMFEIEWGLIFIVFWINFIIDDAMFWEHAVVVLTFHHMRNMRVCGCYLDPVMACCIHHAITGDGRSSLWRIWFLSIDKFNHWWRHVLRSCCCCMDLSSHGLYETVVM